MAGGFPLIRSSSILEHWCRRVNQNLGLLDKPPPGPGEPHLGPRRRHGALRLHGAHKIPKAEILFLEIVSRKPV